ncbi:MAG: ATP-binding protein [Verrucomicrobiota bacterium]
MKFEARQALKNLARLVVSPGLEPALQAARIQTLQRDIILPIKCLLILTLVYYFYFFNWVDLANSSREVALESTRHFFLFYVLATISAGTVLILYRNLPLHLVQWTIFFLGLLDAILFSSLTLVTGGFDSILYWVFLALIVHHATNIPFATPQIVLNLLVCFFYAVAGVLDVTISGQDDFFSRLDAGTREALDIGQPGNPAESFILRIIVLVLMTLWCWGLQALSEKQRRAEEEAKEFAYRQGQLHTAGRLAAEIAHQIKNPLSIINNASFSLQRQLQEGQKSAAEQIQIIREEVDRADRILTDLMGYAQLAEGRVEKLNVIEELERAITQVFPPVVKYDVKIRRSYMPALPPLMMQRSHLSEIFLNILKNAREAMAGHGEIEIAAEHGDDFSAVVTISDSGMGIPKEKLEKIFDAYFSTKEKGTGLGLAIVKHNLDIYGGKVTVESELGKGARFTLQFPAKTLMKLSK